MLEGCISTRPTSLKSTIDTPISCPSCRRQPFFNSSNFVTPSHSSSGDSARCLRAWGLGVRGEDAAGGNQELWCMDHISGEGAGCKVQVPAHRTFIYTKPSSTQHTFITTPNLHQHAEPSSTRQNHHPNQDKTFIIPILRTFTHTDDTPSSIPPPRPCMHRHRSCF